MSQRIAAVALALLLGPAVTSCARAPQDSPPAAHVPTHVVTERDSGKTVAAEQGDTLEVRLAESTAAGTWRLTGVSGDARVEAEGEPRSGEDGGVRVRVFRFRLLRIGTSKLTFTIDAPSDAPEPRRVVTFSVAVS